LYIEKINTGEKDRRRSPVTTKAREGGGSGLPGGVPQFKVSILIKSSTQKVKKEARVNW